MEKCNICPRKCNASRDNGHGFCLAPNKMVISKIMLHQGEEPFLTCKNDKGSGAIFFAGCNLRCVYCQNYKISHEISGKHVSPKELANIFKMLEEKGAGNIDLVTPTHYSLHIIDALKIYKPKVSVVWNSGGYESPETIAKLDGLVDIFLVDFKYYDNSLAEKYSKAPNYKENAIACLKEMKRQIPENIFAGNKLEKGIVVRHLVLPTCAKDSFKVLDTVCDILGKDALVSIMSQFTPYGECEKYPEINRQLTNLEYKAVVAHALKLGLDNALVQDICSATTEMIPDFDGNIIDF